MKTVVCLDIYKQPHEMPVGELRWRPSVYGVLIKDDKVLMAKQFGKYGLPGGGIDLGEQPEEALRREFIEETGLTVCDPMLLSAQSDFFKPPHTNADGCIQSIQLFYNCRYESGDLSTAGFDDHEQEHAEIAEWINLRQLDDIETYGTPDFKKEIKKAAKLLKRDS